MSIEKIMFVQHKDRTVTANDYASLGPDLLVTSVFLTLQGEGPYAGHPAVFVRLAGCNYGAKDFACQFCDTSFEFDRGRRVAHQELLEEIMALPGYNSSQLLVLTGGEPTLQHNILQFMELAAPHFTKICIESNGTQSSFFKAYRERILRGEVPVNSHICVSPKASLKAGRYAELNPIVLWSAHCLKFVVCADPESPHHTVPDWAFAAQKSYMFDIYISPMAKYRRSYEGEVSSIWDTTLVDHETTAANYAYAAQYALDHQCLLSVQTHLFTAIP